MPESIKNNNNKAINGRFSPTTREVCNGMVEILGKWRSEARRLGNIGAMAIMRKFCSSE